MDSDQQEEGVTRWETLAGWPCGDALVCHLDVEQFGIRQIRGLSRISNCAIERDIACAGWRPLDFTCRRVQGEAWRQRTIDGP